MIDEAMHVPDWLREYRLGWGCPLIPRRINLRVCCC